MEQTEPGVDGISQTRSFSVNMESSNVSTLERLWNSTGDLLMGRSEEATIAKNTRSIRFNSAVKVVLIPARVDYEVAELSKSLWWDHTDYEVFKTDAVSELKSVMVMYKMNGKDASIYLYQQDMDSDVAGSIAAPKEPLPMSTAGEKTPGMFRDLTHGIVSTQVPSASSGTKTASDFSSGGGMSVYGESPPEMIANPIAVPRAKQNTPTAMASSSDQDVSKVALPLPIRASGPVAVNISPQLSLRQKLLLQERAGANSGPYLEHRARSTSPVAESAEAMSVASSYPSDRAVEHSVGNSVESPASGCFLGSGSGDDASSSSGSTGAGGKMLRVAQKAKLMLNSSYSSDDSSMGAQASVKDGLRSLSGGVGDGEKKGWQVSAEKALLRGKVSVMEVAPGGVPRGVHT